MLMMSNNTLKLRKNNKNGFTLIELLAVIVILALIALITTPIILNVVENAKRSAAVDSTYGYIKAIEYNNTMAQASNKYQLITENDAKKINELVTIKGNKATEGIIEYDKNYNVATANICMSEYKVVYKNGEAKANGERCGEKFDFTKPVVQITKVASTTKEINVDFVATDEESDIDEAICEYGTTKKYGNKGIVTNNSKCTINDLQNNTKYYIKLTAKNGNKLSESLEMEQTTGNFASIDIALDSIDWKPQKEVTITGETNGAKLEYKVVVKNDEGNYETKVDWTTYNQKIIVNWTSTAEKPTMIYARFNDGKNTSEETTLSITKVDASEPDLSLENLVKTTTSIVIPYTATDSESEIKETTCEYGTSESYGSNGIVENNTCTISDLTSGQTYYYKLTTINGSGLTKEVKGNTQTGTTTVSFDVTSIQSDTEEQSKKVKITYTTSNVTNPTYYFKSTVNATSDADVSSCGTEENPGSCSGATTTIIADTWYKTTSTTPSITFTSNGTLYGMIHDGKDYLTASNQTV